MWCPVPGPVRRARLIALRTSLVPHEPAWNIAADRESSRDGVSSRLGPGGGRGRKGPGRGTAPYPEDVFPVQAMRRAARRGKGPEGPEGPPTGESERASGKERQRVKGIESRKLHLLLSLFLILPCTLSFSPYPGPSGPSGPFRSTSWEEGRLRVSLPAETRRPERSWQPDQGAGAGCGPFPAPYPRVHPRRASRGLPATCRPPAPPPSGGRSCWEPCSR